MSVQFGNEAGLPMVLKSAITEMALIMCVATIDPNPRLYASYDQPNQTIQFSLLVVVTVFDLGYFQLINILSADFVTTSMPLLNVPSMFDHIKIWRLCMAVHGSDMVLKCSVDNMRIVWSGVVIH